MERKIYLVLDNIRSRENVGSIFRTADAVGVSKIYLCGITPTPSVGNSNIQIPNYKQAPNSKFSRFVSNRGSSIAMQSGQIQNQDRIAKTALGAEKWVPWEYVSQTWRLLKQLSADGFQVLALEQTKDSVDIFKLKARNYKLITIVVGNEVRGISPKILKYCDKIVHIPMHGKKESLNVSVATSIALYSLLQNGKN